MEGGGERKRAKSDNTMFWTKFKTSNYVSHHNLKHPASWANYQKISNVAKLQFFANKTPVGPQQSLINTHFDASQPWYFFVKRPIVDELIKKLLLAEDDPDSEDDEAIPLASFSEKSLLIFDGDWNEENMDIPVADDVVGPTSQTHYRVRITQVLMFRLVVRHVAAGCSFRQVVEILIATKEITGLGKIGCPNEGTISKMVRVVCALNFDVIAALLTQVWAFSLAFDMADHVNDSYIDLRVRFELSGQIHDVHVILIPMVDKHTGQNMSGHIMKVLDALCPAWKYTLIGVASDGTSNNTGRYEGAVTYLQKAVMTAGDDGTVPSKFFRSWCVLHQLDLIFGGMLKELDGGQWLPQTQATSTHLRRQAKFVHYMKTKCPAVQMTRWLAMGKLIAWLITHWDSVYEHYNSLEPPHQSHPSDK
jgi:hypothetical protein